MMRRRNKERGLALVSVLWGVSLLGVIATLALSASLSHRRIEANSWKDVRARTIAEAAVMRGVLALIDSRPAQRWRIDGAPQEFVFDGISVAVAIEDELGKIDLNTARDDILRGLFRAVAPDQALADALTDRVLDWRLPSDGKRPNGATPADYRDANSPVRPRGAAFQSVDELKLVLGMTAALYDAAAPAVTVYSQRSAIDPATAPPLVLRAAGQTGPAGARRPVTLDPAMGLGGRAFTIEAAVPLEDRLYVHRAVIRLTGDPARPYWILAWDSAPARKP